jgi:hypothetical protein
LIEQYKGKDSKELASKLEETMIIASALNRMVLRSDLTPELRTEWQAIHKDMNSLASVFGYPVLPNVIVAVTSSN